MSGRMALIFLGGLGACEKQQQRQDARGTRRERGVVGREAGNLCCAAVKTVGDGSTNVQDAQQRFDGKIGRFSEKSDAHGTAPRPL